MAPATALKLEIHSLIWPQADMRMLEGHRSVTGALGLDVKYSVEKVEHGEWMDALALGCTSDVIGFLDIDCIPLDRAIVDEAAHWAAANDSFCGIAQASNRPGGINHLYAGPAFLFVSRRCYERVKVSFLETRRSDVAEEFTYVAEERGIRFRALYPTHFEREPREGIWHLGSYGFFGIGTVYDGRVYHLYQGRFEENRELFLRRCEEVAAGAFDTSGMHAARNYAYPGRVAPLGAAQRIDWSAAGLRAEVRNRIMRLRPRFPWIRLPRSGSGNG